MTALADHFTVTATPRGPRALVTTRGGFVHTLMHRGEVAALPADRFPGLLEAWDAAPVPADHPSHQPAAAVPEILAAVRGLQGEGS